MKIVDFDYLCFSGAGNRGFMYLGAIRCFHKHFKSYYGISFNEYITRVKGFAGTSIGALCAFLLYVNLSLEDINDIFAPFIHSISNIVNPDFQNFFTKYGFDDGKIIKNQIKQILIKSKIQEDATLGDLKRFFSAKFICCATDIKSGEPVYFSAETHPTVKIYDALYMSMCVPYIFIPVKMNNTYYVDGFLSDNIPRAFPEKNTIYFIFDTFEENKLNSLIDFSETILNLSMKRQRIDDSLYLSNKSSILLTLPDYMLRVSNVDFTIHAHCIQQMINCGFASILCEFDKELFNCIRDILSITVRYFLYSVSNTSSSNDHIHEFDYSIGQCK